MRNKLQDIFWFPISPFSILISGFFSFMWGLWVALPLWQVFPNSPIYTTLDFYGSEIIWGTIQMAVGIALILASFDSLKSMKWATFAGFCSWSLISLAFAAAAWHNPGMWVAGFIATTNAYMFLNTSKWDKN